MKYYKILYLSNSNLSNNSANCIHVLKMCDAFTNLNHDVLLFAKCSKIIKFKSLKSKFSLKNNFVIKFSKINYPLQSFFVSLFWGFKSLFSRRLIYSRNRHASFILSIFSTIQSYELHGIPSSTIQRYLDFFICRRKQTSIIAISNALKIDIAQIYSIPLSRILVAHDGADHLVNTQKKLFNSKSINIGYTGSFIKGKGVDVFCEVAKLNQDYTFHVLGGNKHELDSFKLKYPYKNLIFHGYLDFSKVCNFINSFSITILPNYPDVILPNSDNIGKYTSPLKLFEYMSLKSNIVLSDIPVFREIVSDDEVTFFEPGNITSLHNAIGLALQHPPNSSKLHKKFLKYYSWEARINHILSFIN